MRKKVKELIELEILGHINQKNPITAPIAIIVMTVKFNSPVAAFMKSPILS